MKKNKKTLLLLILFIVLFGLYFCLKILKPFETSVNIFNIKEGTIKEIEIINSGRKIKFTKENESWKMIEPYNYSIINDKVDSLKRSIENMVSRRIIDKKVNDLSPYGLDEPKMSISVTSKESKKSTIYIGAKTISDSQYYIKVSDKRDVYIIDKGTIDKFKTNAEDYRDNNLFDIDLSKILSFEMFEESGDRYKIVNNINENKWQFVLPVTANVKNDAMFELIEKMKKSKIERFITINENKLFEYGLEKPSHTLIIKDNNGNSQTVYFGKKEENLIFVKKDTSPEVSLILSNMFSPEDIIFSELLDVALLSVGIDKVSKVIVIESGNRIEFIKDAAGKRENIFMVNGKEIGSDDFNTMYVNIMALSAGGYDTKINISEPELTIILELINGNEEIRVDFSKRNKDTFFITFNGEPMSFYVHKSKIDLVKYWVKRVIK